MFINAGRIALLAPHVAAPIAAQLAAALETAMPQFGVTSLLERAHFMAQACHETSGFTRFEEDLNYTTPARLAAMFSAVHGEADAAMLIRKGPQAIADRVYADRDGNGNEASGDGWRYRGRGCFQLTCRANYSITSKGLGHDFVTTPDLVAQPEGAALTALWVWRTRGLSGLASLDDVASITRVINGPEMVGLDDRRVLAERAKRIFV